MGLLKDCLVNRKLYSMVDVSLECKKSAFFCPEMQEEIRKAVERRYKRAKKIRYAINPEHKDMIVYFPDSNEYQSNISEMIGAKMQVSVNPVMISSLIIGDDSLSINPEYVKDNSQRVVYKKFKKLEHKIYYDDPSSFLPNEVLNGVDVFIDKGIYKQYSFGTKEKQILYNNLKKNAKIIMFNPDKDSNYHFFKEFNTELIGIKKVVEKEPKLYCQYKPKKYIPDIFDLEIYEKTMDYKIPEKIFIVDEMMRKVSEENRERYVVKETIDEDKIYKDILELLKTKHGKVWVNQEFNDSMRYQVDKFFHKR